ncbi:MAG TPA: DUF1549 and DUF1553 domain-containing protein [Chthonomonadaceae bacterium]|nr:DUF1549 and DUF1553 domain-containing protein [Chthonomonadaceae bacterium]
MTWRLAAGTILALAACVAGSVAQADSRPSLAPTAIDRMIRAEWQKEDVTPAARVDDAGYLRRIYLDITGTIPPPQAVEDFMADKSPDKRQKAVDALLDSPRYADQWTTYWDRVLMVGAAGNARNVDRFAFRQWLHAQFDNNTPWNRFVYDLITATGQNSTGGNPNAKMMGRMAADDNDHPEDAAKVNGATNWILRYTGKPEDLSGNASKVFLGVQIQCAQCHDHKTEKWKQSDFRSFTANFVNTRPQLIDPKNAKGNKDYRTMLVDINRPFVPRGKKAGNTADYVSSVPMALDGTDFSNAPNRRQALAEWMVGDQNPWFAEAIVNRIWAHFMGRGFVEPIDDFRPSNPAVMPELLQALSEDFKASGYDLKHLIRTICATQVYQVSSMGAARADSDNKLWAKFRLKPMRPEQLVDSLVLATNIHPLLERVAGGNIDAVKMQLNRQFEFLFDVDEEFEQKDFEGTIPQALLLLNGPLVNRSVTPIPGTALADTLAMPDSDSQKIEALYLRTLSRKPTASELQRWTAFVNAPRELVTEENAPQAPPNRANARADNKQMKQQAGKKNRNTGFDPLARANGRLAGVAKSGKEQAYEDLFWALLNSSEFLFNH